MDSFIKRYQIPLCLAAWWLFLGLINLYWLNRDTVPPDWDPAKHLTSSLRYYHALQDPGIFKNRLTALLNVDDYYPPLAPLAASLFYFVLPSDSDTATWVLNQLFLGLLLIATYRLGLRMYTPETGGLAAMAVTSFPIITIQSRTYMLDLPVTAMTALGMYALLRTENFRHRGASILFGVIAGLATLTKWTFLFFILLPLTYALAKAVKAEDRLTRLKNSLAVFSVWGLVGLPWFLAHFSSLIFTSIKFGYTAGVRKGDPEIFTMGSLLYYATLLPMQVLLPWIVCFLIGLVFYFRHEVKRNPLLILWILGGYAILTLLRNKDGRFILPFIPAVALIATGWLVRFDWSVRIKRSAWILLGLYSVGVALYMNPPRLDVWPMEEAVTFMQTQKTYHPHPRLRAVPDSAYFERHGFEYYAEAARFPLDVTTWVRFPTFTDFVVTKTGDQGVRHDPVEIMQTIQRDREGFEAVFKKKWQRPLPDGSVGRVYVRDITPVAGITPEAFIQKFKIALADYLARYVKDPQGWTVRVDPFSDRETLAGRFRAVRFSMESALFERKPGTGNPLTVRDLGMDLLDLTINPYKLLRDGELEIISLMEAEPHLTITEADLNRFLSGLKGPLHPKVEFQEGIVRIHAASKGWIPRLDLEIEPNLVNEENLGFEFLRFRIGGLWVPTFIPQMLTAKFNPVLKPMPCRMHLRTLRTDHGNFVLNE
jgi:Dolichyl-phosphate-mannose-protein mannosyltransferase/LmeA-like phospholipid-binding